MSFRHLVVGSLVAGTLVLSGCGGSAAAGPGGSKEITVTGTDSMRFNPDTINVKAGEAVTISFKNAGVIAHDLVTEGGEKNARLVNLGGGKQQSGTFQASKPGTYQMVCNQPGHKEAGMVGKIVVGQ